jgi:cytochrome c peroxidase
MKDLLVSLTRGFAGPALCMALLTIGWSAVGGPAKPRPAKSVEAAFPPSPLDEIPVRVRVFFRPLPERMPGSEDDTSARVALGRKLYFERGMSLTQSQSCNDCHFLHRLWPGVDGLPTSPGAKGIAGTRNAPTVLNAGFQKAQFWDGRAADLVEQAKEPLLNPIEMAMATEQDVMNRVKNRPDLVAAFRLAFPDQPEPVTFDNVARALAAFERTLVTPSRFDRYLRGQTHALTREEKRGLDTFMDLHCIECHSGIPVGGRLLRKLGVYRPYENQSDLGRFDVTQDEQDKFVFKVGMLRNVTLTAPYFHDGRVPTLSEAIRRMASMQLDMEISPTEIDEIICFLRCLEAEKREWIEVPISQFLHLTAPRS